MGQHADVLIVGGGVIGLTTAYYLARAGARVELLDRGDLGREASWAGAGILPPGDPTHARTPFDRLRALGVAAFPGLSAELRERTGLDNGYLRCGGLEFVTESAHAAEHEWRGEGVRFEPLTEAEVQALQPGLGPALGPVYHLPDMAQLRNPRHMKALAAGCGALGVFLRPHVTVHGFMRTGSRVTAVETDFALVSAGQFLVAGGAWTDTLLRPLGCPAGVRPVRGQIALLNTGTPLLHKVLLSGARYVVPRPDGRVLVGSTEEEAGFDKSTTAGAVRELLALATRLAPALADAPFERCWAGLRPGSPDGFPVLGRVPGADNVFVAAGHFRAGIQLSPGTAQVLTELLLGRPVSVPLDSFAPDRFGSGPR